MVPLYENAKRTKESKLWRLCSIDGSYFYKKKVININNQRTCLVCIEIGIFVILIFTFSGYGRSNSVTMKIWKNSSERDL